MRRINEIEGLRGALACWVMVAHCLGAAGFEPHEVDGVLKIIRNAGYAVDVFVIISGFVIALLLDRSRESYVVFISRRWFRLFPLYAICMLLGAAFCPLQLSNLHHTQAWLSPERYLNETKILETILSNPLPYAILALLMLQGTVPDMLLPDAPVAFLGTAWSISLEWQFYLVAPFLVFSLLNLNNTRKLVITTGIICTFYVAALFQFIPFVSLGAFLPFHIEFFYIGIISYAILSYYSKYSNHTTYPWTLLSKITI